MDARLEAVMAAMETRAPGNPTAVVDLAANYGIRLPDDYVEFIARSNGAAGDVGAAWVEFWSVEEILETAEGETPYDGVLLFGGDGGNTVYGFDDTRDGEIVEGDWIGLPRERVLVRGRTLSDMVASIGKA